LNALKIITNANTNTTIIPTITTIVAKLARGVVAKGRKTRANPARIADKNKKISSIKIPPLHTNI
jgi:hypothetical protein